MADKNSTSAAASAFSSPALQPADDAFLDQLSRRACRYFWEQADAHSGLICDRAHLARPGSLIPISSIAVTGFGLTALPIAAARGWLDPRQARRRALAALEFFARDAAHQQGWFYHFYDMPSGRPAPGSEVSSMDTALLLCGMLSAAAAFPDLPRLRQLAQMIYDRVNFRWMLNGSSELLSMGWHPESGFLAARWNSYCEQTVLYLLAIGAERNPLPARSWYAFQRPWREYAGYRYVAGASPLFIHQYSHAWADYRGRRERHDQRLNYFENSIAATRAQRAYCAALARRFTDYGPRSWGITASESRHGYIAWGGPAFSDSYNYSLDGTLVPCAAAGSLMFTPRLCLADLRHMLRAWHSSMPAIWGRYGFCDAFNPLTGWVSEDVLGINQGISLLSAENFRSGGVWRWFMRHPAPRRAMQKIGLLPEPARA